jgi:hypothetical protein
MTTARRKIDRVALRETLRKSFPGGPREALRKLGLDETILDVPRLAMDGAKNMPNRLQFLAVTRTAAALNPLLMAMDAKKNPITVDYAPLFKGLTTKNLKTRKKQIVADAAKLLKGKTIAKDASVEHLAHMLDQFEHVPNQANLDESVSPEQHKAMEAAAHGHSNLGIPKNVGKEFEQADKGKSFDEMLMDWAKDKHMSEDDMEALKKMHADSMPDNALDHEAEDEDEEEEEEEAEDEHEDGEDEDRGEALMAGKDKGAKDKHHGAHDSRKPAKRERKFITADELKKAVEAERQNNRSALEAREFVRPYVGDVSIALDSAPAIYRAAAEAMGLNADMEDKDFASLSPVALKTLIKKCGQTMAEDEERESRRSLAQDENDGETASGFDTRWGDLANRIGHA